MRALGLRRTVEETRVNELTKDIDKTLAMVTDAWEAQDFSKMIHLLAFNITEVNELADLKINED